MSTWNSTRSGSESNRRRSQRAILCLPITVRVEGSSPEASFEEVTQTLVVNAHGALIAIAGKVEKGQRIRLTNRTTQEERTCRVMYLGPVSGGKTQVGVEFDEPSPAFWRMTFPPDDWIAPEQAPATSQGTK